MDTTDIEKLSNLSEFARFVEYIHEMREASVYDLRGASVDKIQQIAGEINACDELLKVANWDLLRQRHLSGMFASVATVLAKNKVAKKKVAKKRAK